MEITSILQHSHKVETLTFFFKLLLIVRLQVNIFTWTWTGSGKADSWKAASGEEWHRSREWIKWVEVGLNRVGYHDRKRLAPKAVKDERKCQSRQESAPCADVSEACRLRCCHCHHGHEDQCDEISGQHGRLNKKDHFTF